MTPSPDFHVDAFTAAYVVGVSPSTIYVWKHRGKLTAVEGTWPLKFRLSCLYAIRDEGRCAACSAAAQVKDSGASGTPMPGGQHGGG